MYKRITVFLSFLIVLLFAVSIGQAQSSQQQKPPDGWTIDVLEADENHLILELTVTDVESQLVEHDGVTYRQFHTVDLPSWGKVGQPQLPMHNVLVGMPQNGTPNVEILDFDKKIEEDVLVYPVPSIVRDDGKSGSQLTTKFALDTEMYQADSLFPAVQAEATEIGFWRYQPAFQLRLYPFQYNPQQRELIIYERLLVQVTYNPSPSKGEGQGVGFDPVFEQELERTMINYHSLPRPKVVSHDDVEQAQDTVTVHGKIADNASNVKIKIKKEGFYRLTYNTLNAIAPDLVSGNPKYLFLSMQGGQIPILIEGEDDGSFDAEDSILFYGHGIDSPYTQYNIYWLSVLTDTVGLRMTSHDGTPTGEPTVGLDDSFDDTRLYEKDLLYWQAMPGEAGIDRWFWDKLDSSNPLFETDFIIKNNDYDSQSGLDGHVRISFQAFTFDEHNIQIELNNNELFEGGITWSGQTEYIASVSVPLGYFYPNNEESLHTFAIENLTPSSSDVYINWIEVTYRDMYVSEENYLAFSAPTTDTHTFEITEFATDTIHLFDVTSPITPVEVVNYQLNSDQDKYILKFTADASPASHYIAFSNNYVTDLTSNEVILDEPSELKQDILASYVIITHPDFYDTIQELAEYRTEKFEVMTVKVDDIYDEFNHGIKSPQAIRAFLEHAFMNGPMLGGIEFVLLVGDASLDPKMNRPDSLPDLMPSYYSYVHPRGEIPNDSWFVKVAGDDNLPDLKIGRMPVRTNSELKTVINKIKVYEQTEPGDWSKRAIFVADDAAKDEEVIFKQDMEKMMSLMHRNIDSTLLSFYEPERNVVSEVNKGALLLTYSGHGTDIIWGQWAGVGDDKVRIFDLEQMERLQNGDKLPFLVVANCLSGFFSDNAENEHHEDARAMGEEFLLNANGGGVASWAPTAEGLPEVNTEILTYLYQTIMDTDEYVLGSAVTTARTRAILSGNDYNIGVLESFTYLGDPALELNVPANISLSGSSEVDEAKVGDILQYTIVYTVAHAPKAWQLELRNTFPESVIFQSASVKPDSAYDQTLIWNLGDVAAGTYSIDVSVLFADYSLKPSEEFKYVISYLEEEDFTLQITINDSNIENLILQSDGPTVLGEATTFMAATTSGSNIHYWWTFGDDPEQPSFTESAIKQYTFTERGTYTVSVRATNNSTDQAGVIASTVVHVGIPVANFASSSPDLLGQVTTFHSTSLGEVDSYAWDFGDGENDNTTEPNHAYQNTGVYTTTLTVTTGSDSDTISYPVHILNTPVASFTVNNTLHLGQIAEFENLSTSGGDDESNVTYLWDFGDGLFSMSKSPSHFYSHNGTYTVDLTVYNSVDSHTTSQVITVSDAPIESFNLYYVPAEDNTVTLVAHIITGTNIQYNWNWGDSNAEQTTSAPIVNHTYANTATYQVAVTAQNGHGSVVKNIQVNTAITGTAVIPDEVITGLGVDDEQTNLGDMTNLVATTEDGSNITNGEHITYLWDFGNGTTIASQKFRYPYLYKASGTYTVTVWAMSRWGGEQANAKAQVSMAKAIDDLALSATPMTYLNQTTIFTATTQGGPNVTYMWNFGDGTVDVTDSPFYSHVYRTPGTYSITLLAYNRMSSDVVQVNTTVQASVAVQGLTIGIGSQESGIRSQECDSFSYCMEKTNLLYSSTISNSRIPMGKEIIFMAESITGTNMHYAWNFGDDATGATDQPTYGHTYGKVDTYTIQLLAGNEQSSQLVSDTIIIYQDDAIDQVTIDLSNMEIDPIETEVLIDTPVIFIADAEGGDNINYEWDFGMGEPVKTTLITHTFVYSFAGQYNVKLKAFNSRGYKGSNLQITAVSELVDESYDIYLPIILK